MMPRLLRPFSPSATGLRLGALTLALLLAPSARAGLFDDEEARRAILDLRTRITTNDDAAKARSAELAQANAQLLEQLQQLRRGLLELSTQLDAMKADNARLRGSNEQLQRDQQKAQQDQQALATSVAELQRQLKDQLASVQDRLKKVEPVKVTVDGREFLADPDEKRGYDAALAALRTGDFDKGAAALTGFLRRWPESGYGDSARFWLANALYGQKNYKDAIATFRSVVSNAPEHPRAPEALLSIASCQVEMKDTKTARKTIEELIKAYPQSEAANAGRERLAGLKG